MYIYTFGNMQLCWISNKGTICVNGRNICILLHLIHLFAIYVYESLSV